MVRSVRTSSDIVTQHNVAAFVVLAQAAIIIIANLPLMGTTVMTHHFFTPLTFVIITLLITGSFLWAVEEPRALPRSGRIVNNTVIAENHQPLAAIIYPADDSAVYGLVERLNQALTDAYHITLPTYSADQVTRERFFIRDDYKQQHLILLGNINTNPALVQLAANLYCYASAEYPGDQSYALRTAINPWGTGKNVILLTASDNESLSLAVDDFIAGFSGADVSSQCVIEPMVKVVQDGQDLSQRPAGRLRYVGKVDGTYQLADAIDQYNRTGSQAQFERARELLVGFLDENKAPTHNDYGTEVAVVAIDLIDTVMLTTEQQSRLDALYLQWVLDILEEKPYWNPMGKKWSFGGHQAHGAMGFNNVCKYLLHNANLNESARQIVSAARAKSREFLNYLSQSFKDEQKDVGWETWTPILVLPRYALADDDMTFFDSGTAHRVMQRRFYAQRGYRPAGIIAFVLNDGRYKTLIPDGDLFNGWAFPLEGPRWVTPDSLEPEAPDFLLGTQVLPTSAIEHGLAYNPDFSGAFGWHTDLPHERTFHVIGFCSGIGENDTLAVLNGFDSSRYSGDAQSLRYFKTNGHEFLKRADGDDNRNPRPGRFYQNSILVESGDYDQAPACAAELLDHFNSPEMGLCATRLADYHGVDWTRRVVWLRDKLFVIIDECGLAGASSANVVAQFWSNDLPGLKGNRWSASTAAGQFHLVAANAEKMISQQWWPGGPAQLRQVKKLNAACPQVAFLNTFYVADADNPISVETRAVSPGLLLVQITTTTDNSSVPDAGTHVTYALIGTVGDKGVAHNGLEMSAGFVCITPGAYYASDAETRFMDEPVTSDTCQDNAALWGRVQDALRQLWDSDYAYSASADNAALPLPASSWEVSQAIHLPIQTDYQQITPTSFTVDADGVIIWDLLDEQMIHSLEGLTLPDDAETLQVQLSNDNFQADIRTLDLAPAIKDQWVYYQYGYGARIGVDIYSIDQSARYVRVAIAEDQFKHGQRVLGHWHRQPWNVTGHNPELFNRPFWQDIIFRNDKLELRYTMTKACDVDFDGSEEVLFVTDQNELILVDSHGKVLFSHHFDAPVTDAIAAPFTESGNCDIIVATMNHQITVLSHTGQVRMMIDFLERQDEIGRVCGANGLSIYTDCNGEPALFVSTYHQRLAFDRQGKLLDQAFGSGFYLDATPDRACDMNGDGAADFLIRDNVWGLVSFINGADFQALKSIKTDLGGKGLELLIWPEPDDAIPTRFLTVAESGLALLRLTHEDGRPIPGGDAVSIIGGIETVFAYPIDQVSAVKLADVNADGRPEIMITSLNGAFVIIDETGRILYSGTPALQVYDVAVVQYSAGAVCFLATEKGIVTLDAADPARLSRVADTAGCCKLQAVRDDSGRDLVLAFFSDGRVMPLVYPGT